MIAGNGEEFRWKNWRISVYFHWESVSRQSLIFSLSLKLIYVKLEFLDKARWVIAPTFPLNSHRWRHQINDSRSWVLSTAVKFIPWMCAKRFRRELCAAKVWNASKLSHMSSAKIALQSQGYAAILWTKFFFGLFQRPVGCKKCFFTIIAIRDEVIRSTFRFRYDRQAFDLYDCSAVFRSQLV